MTITPLAPKVNGPLSEWSSTILLEGCVPGATVRVISLTRPDGEPVASGNATSGTVRLPLTPGIKLNAKDRLVAAQSANGQDSLPVSSQLAITVAPAPTATASLPNPALATHLWEFGAGVQ